MSAQRSLPQPGATSRGSRSELVDARAEPDNILRSDHHHARDRTEEGRGPRARKPADRQRYDQQVRVVPEGDPFPSQRSQGRLLPDLLTTGAARKISRSLIQKFANDASATAMMLAGTTERPVAVITIIVMPRLVRTDTSPVEM